MVQEQETSSTASVGSLIPGKENMRLSQRNSPRKSPGNSQQNHSPLKGRRHKKVAVSASSGSGERPSSRGVKPSSTNKQQKKKKHFSLWRRSNKVQSQIIGTDDLRELLDVVTTRMRATECIMGQPLQEEQLVSIVKDVLHSRQEADCASTPSGSLSKCDEQGGIALPSDSSETSLQQLVVVLVALLLQHKKLPEVAAPPNGVPSVVLTSLDDNMSQASSKKSTLTDRVECEDEDTVSVSEVSANQGNASLQSKKSVAAAEVTKDGENAKECDVSIIKATENAEGHDDVEYTIEELQGVLMMLRSARGKDDDESTVWSTASTLETSMVEDLSTMDSILDTLISILPDSLGLSPNMDLSLDPLEEESDSDNDGDETSLYTDALSRRENGNADTNYDDCTTKDGATDDDSPSSFFVNLWGSDNHCQSNAGILEEDTTRADRNSYNAMRISDNDDAQSGFFSGIFGNGATPVKENEPAAAPSREVIEQENTAETEATFLGAVFGTSVAAIFTGVQPENKRDVSVKVKGDKSGAFQTEVNDPDRIEDGVEEPLRGIALRRAKSLDDEHAISIENGALSGARILFDGNESSEVAWDRLEQTLADGTQRDDNSPSKRPRSRSLPKLSKTAFLKQFGDKTGPKSAAAEIQRPTDAPGVHSDSLEIVSIPLWMEESESTGDAAKHATGSAWDGEMEYPADEVSVCKSIDAGGSTTSKKNKLGAKASSMLHQYKSEKLAKRSNSDLSLKSGGSMSWKSAVSRTASLASSVVKKPRQKAVPDVAVIKSNTEEALSSPYVARVENSGQDEVEKDNDELSNKQIAKDHDCSTSIVDDAKKDLDDSTEAAWDRLELPLEESSNHIAPEPKKNKTDRAGFSRWMSRRARHPAIQRCATEPDSEMLAKANLNASATSGSSPPRNPRQKRRQHRKGRIESDALYARKQSEHPVVNLSKTTQKQGNVNLQSVETQTQNQNSVRIKAVQNITEMSFTLNDSEANEVESASDLSVVRFDKLDSQWNERWYTNYMKGGKKTKSSASSLAESTTSGVSGNLNFLIGALEEETRTMKRDDWQSFSNSPFKESLSVAAPQNQRVASSGKDGDLHGGHATMKSTKMPKSILRNKNSEGENNSSKRGFKSWRYRKVMEPEKLDGTTARNQCSTHQSSQEKCSVVNVKQRAREFAQRASSRSPVQQEEMAPRRDPTPQRSNVSAGEQWKFFNPDAAPERKPTGGLIRGRNLVVDPPTKSGHKSSPSAVSEGINAFESYEFSQQFGDASGFDGEMSFPPF